MPKQSKVVEGLQGAINEVLDMVKGLSQRVTVLETTKEPERKLEVPQNTKVTGEVPKYPIPQEYREEVNKALNQDFGIEIDYATDSPKFQFSIIVPDKYSNVSVDYKSGIGGRDIRSIWLDNNQGISGIRERLEQIRNSFNQDTKVLIDLDRAKV